MTLLEIHQLYEEWKYEDILAMQDSILHSLDPKQVFVLTKSVIHLYSPDDHRVKDYLFITLCLEDRLSFRWSFSIELSIKKDIEFIRTIMETYDWFMEHIIPKWSIDHVNERYKRHLETLTEKQKNKDIFLIFIFYSLELYDIEHSEYPMIKWLLHHFYKHD
jgi:hypothetical protein